MESGRIMRRGFIQAGLGAVAALIAGQKSLSCQNRSIRKREHFLNSEQQRILEILQLSGGELGNACPECGR